MHFPRRTFLAATSSLLGWALLGCDDERPLEALFSVPSFELTDQDGANYGTAQLQGRVWVASFLFTSCTQACPLLASQLANVRERVAQHGDNVRFVSITVDPDVESTGPGQPITIDVLDNDAAAAGETWDPSTVCIVSDAGPCVTDFSRAGVGRWTVNPDGTVTFLPTLNFGGMAVVDYRVTDTASVVYQSLLTLSVPALASTGLNTSAPLIAGLAALLLGGALVIASAIIRHSRRTALAATGRRARHSARP